MAPVDDEIVALGLARNRFRDRRIEHERNEKEEDVPGEDKLLRESPANIVERARQFMTIKELLTATALGTS